jgi:hypothetical protein
VRGLIVGSPHIDRILSGKKTWEIRGHATKIRGRIMLIRAGSGQVVGSCEIVETIGPLSLNELRRNAGKAGVRRNELDGMPYKRTYAWVVKNAKSFARARSYQHPSGAVVWVNLTGRKGGKR